MSKNLTKTVVTFVFMGLVMFTPSLIKAQTNSNANLEAVVRASFPDMPDMITIANCESGFRQFGPDGNPLRGGASKKYIGIFQISESHSAHALSMAYDINTVEGNIAYARYMYFQRGTAPWISCLGIKPVIAAPAPVIQTENQPANTSQAINSNLSYRMVSPEVLLLQKILNKIGFVITPSGPGSPGNETSMFGELTRAAVKKFQCTKQIVCDGTESTSGFGRVGPRTRALLNQLSQ
jgi:hypothetical protein